MGQVLFRNLPIWLVVRQLDLTLGHAPLPTPSAAIQARQRLGDAPLEQFPTICAALGHSLNKCAFLSCLPGTRNLPLNRQTVRGQVRQKIVSKMCQTVP